MSEKRDTPGAASLAVTRSRHTEALRETVAIMGTLANNCVVVAGQACKDGRIDPQMFQTFHATCEEACRIMNRLNVAPRVITPDTTQQ